MSDQNNEDETTEIKTEHINNGAARNKKNSRVLMMSIAVIFLMGGLVALSIPAYQAFCRITGYGGTTTVADKVVDEIENVNFPHIKVRFDASVDPDLQWDFQPKEKVIEVKPGERMQASYLAKNLSNQKIVGMATYNVTPHSMGKYFTKIQCFCFQSQTLEGGGKAELPLVFFISPDMMDDKVTSGIRTVTLSYTFFRSDEDE